MKKLLALAGAAALAVLSGTAIRRRCAGGSAFLALGAAEPSAATDL